jgi:hypothetical protein
VIYPRGYKPPAAGRVPATNVATATGGAYATSICTSTPCRNVQAFLNLPVNTVFPDGCVLPLVASPGSVTDLTASPGTKEIDWTVADSTCAADPAATPIDDPNIPAYTTVYVEEKVNTLGGGTADSPIVTTTTAAP